MLFRANGMRQGAVTGRDIGPGDLAAGGESIDATMTADANSTILAASIAAGVVQRSGMTAGRTDTTDTAENVLKALTGNDFDRNILPGLTFKFLYQQTVAFATTWAHGRGWVAGLGTLNVAASTVREFLCRILNGTKEVTVSSGTTNASKVITFDVPQAPGIVTPGMLVSGTGITAGTKVVGLTWGDTTNRVNMDKITGVTTDTNSTATTASGVALTFSPVIEINGLRSSTL